jgi:energy-converting hydrogenase B subunit D
MILEGSLLALVVLVLIAVEMKDLFHAVIVLAGADLLLAFVFLQLSAPDIALTQAAVGACITAFVFVAAISRTRRNEE